MEESFRKGQNQEKSFLKIIKPSTNQLQIKSVQQTENKLLVATNNPENATPIMTNQSLIKKNNTLGSPTVRFPRIIINDVPSSRSTLSSVMQGFIATLANSFQNESLKLITGLQNQRSIIFILSHHEVSKQHLSAMCTLYK